MSNGFIDMVGQSFGRLMVVAHDGGRRWRCRCECGQTISTEGYSLRAGLTRSCGCIRRELVVARNTTHGQSNGPTYSSWLNAKKRCFNARSRYYPNYGGRGIVMCAEWRDNFQAFLRDMGERPNGTTLDRIDSDGPYAPGNCRWATGRIQGNNKRNNHIIEHAGECLTLQAWADRTGINRLTILKRLNRGWSAAEALNA